MLLQYFITLSLASGNLSQLSSNAVGCCNSNITVFHREHFIVLLRNGKDWYAFSFLYFQYLIFFFFTEHARSPWTSLSQCWICPWQKRDSHQRSELHPYLQDSSSFTASVLLMLLVLLQNFSCFTGELDHFSCCDTPAVTHHGIMARYRKIDLFS
jgi:hypothetical protein